MSGVFVSKERAKVGLVTYFICLQRGGSEGSKSVPFRLYGGSKTIEDGDRSDVDLNLIVNACPPENSSISMYPRK